jgi:hypothetical protein
MKILIFATFSGLPDADLKELNYSLGHLEKILRN